MLTLLAKRVAVGATLVLAGGALMVQPSSAATGGGACTLKGQANFHPGPGIVQAATWSYDFGGGLTNCQSNVGAPASGLISAGQKITVAGVEYQEPVPTGAGSCASGTTKGTAIVVWSDNTKTVIEYNTTSAGAGVALQGTVVSSVPVTGPTGVVTITTTRFLGAGVAGLLAFEVAAPAACTTPGGATTAGIDGVTGIGSQA